MCIRDRHFLFGALVAGLCALVFLYLPGFPALVLTGCSFPESWRTGLRLLRGKKLRALAALAAAMPVSYTHLDVYKRQAFTSPTTPKW